MTALDWLNAVAGGACLLSMLGVAVSVMIRNRWPRER